ncbi:MAG TPA: hypothetical protein VN516_05560 [Candidatus Baltobacteraceae bacterium]|nr:hypothetical protein [Candidatus Baltobacteraceae bacterium]
MNKNLLTIILVVACIGLAIALIAINSHANKEIKNSATTIVTFSNQLSEAHDQIVGLSQVNVVLSNNLAASEQTTSTLSNQLSDAQTTIVKAEQQITNLNDQVAALETQNKELDQHLTALTNQISQLDTQIAETQMKLSQSQTNNAFLESELKKQVAERTALEQKFNNLSQVREQVHKLKEDALIATRLQWIREGTDPSRQQVKGAQLLMQHPMTSSGTTTTSPNNGSLNVEVEAGGAVRIIPSATETNSPPQ